MKLVLLSGGSGKRLWPLSNQLKPKQFIEILPDTKGGYESMFQRVIGQIKEGGLLKDTVIATTEQQVNLIKNQLEEDIPVILEPSSRDTFPAISLAAVYLYEKMGCSLEEVVCVSPVDVYAESSFFQTLYEAENKLKHHPFNLALVGIKPSYPAEKYGYILPEKTDDKSIWKVKRFVEKPKKEKAIELMAQNAMWNCGVFCFKLGFLINLLQIKGVSLIYEELIKEYHQLPKISFDYEVVEKIDSTMVIPYLGDWNDLGTWDVLTDKMNISTIGKGYLSDDSVNTHIINHLNMPVLVAGLSDLIVIATEEGILVSDKSKSPKLKDYINKLIGDIKN